MEDKEGKWKYCFIKYLSVRPFTQDMADEGCRRD